MTKTALKKEVMEYGMVAIGTLMYGIGVTVFMLPYKLATGGLAGICALIYYATGLEIEISYAIINTVLLVSSAKLLGWKFSVKSLWGYGLITFWLWLCQRIFEDPVTHELPFIIGENEAFMGCLLCAFIEGFALALCFNANGSTGGTDIIAAVINKYRDVSLGMAIMVTDIIIVGSSWWVLHDVRKIIFGFVLLIVSALTLDYCTRRFHQSIIVYIFSRNYKRISDAISKAGFGLTVLDGTGWWTKTERKVLMCVCTKRHSREVFEIVNSVDPTAFVSITNAQNVYGEGFDMMKMKMKGQKPILVFSTNNQHKLDEVNDILSDRFEVRSLKEIGCFDELPETHQTIEENALEKASYVNEFYGFDCFADDTALEIDALNGEPGVYSARYANENGNDHNSKANMEKVLQKLEGKHGEERKARFRTVISLIYQGQTHTFEGIINGHITEKPQGTDGFGYDPIFMPDGYDRTFAQMTAEEKNQISHRGLAVEKLANFFATDKKNKR